MPPKPPYNSTAGQRKPRRTDNDITSSYEAIAAGRGGPGIKHGVIPRGEAEFLRRVGPQRRRRDRPTLLCVGSSPPAQTRPPDTTSRTSLVVARTRDAKP